ncbi:MAG: TldD/PmbA family protein [Desulfuromonadaceae bacterium]
MTLNDYLQRFEVSLELIRQVIAEGMSKGGDYCDVFYQHSISDHIELEDNEVNRAYSNIDLGVGIRVIKGYQSGYSFTEIISPESMKKAARTAASIADSNTNLAVPLLSEHKPASYYKINTPWEYISIDKKIPYLQRINEKVFQIDSRIIKSTISFNNSSSYILFANSEGRITYDYQPMGQIWVSCTAEQNDQREQNGFNLSGRHGIEFFTDANVNRLAEEAVSRTVSLFNAGKPEAGEMEVVLSAGCSGILLHEAIGHGMEADFNRKNISIFSDKIGKTVAESFVTIVDDGTNPYLMGSINIDDEGNDTEKTYLIENGVMKSYLHDRLSAKFYGVNPTGNGRRESFRHIPLPRMRNTYMMPGPHKREDIIASVKKGIIADTFTNGEVMIGGGDFTFYVKSGFLIENGKIQGPIKDINIIGNGPEVLRNIVMVADDFMMTEGGGTCGKDGQAVPVSMGLPTVKVAKINVSA